MTLVASVSSPSNLITATNPSVGWPWTFPANRRQVCPEKWQFVGGRDSTHTAFAAVLQTTSGRLKFETGPFGRKAQRSGNRGFSLDRSGPEHQPAMRRGINPEQSLSV